MKGQRLSTVRNIGFVAHIDAGKTTVTERVLFYSGKIHRMGEVHDGQATMDWMVLEQERGITITSAVTTCLWNDHEIHIIDTPGHVDFTIEVERSLRVLDGAVIILCAVGGVEAQTETVCMQARKYAVPMLAFINKLDRMGADYDAVVAQMRERLEVVPVPVQLPVYDGTAFSGVADLLSRELLTWTVEDQGERVFRSPLPPRWTEPVLAARELLVESLADHDDEVMNCFVEGEEVSADLLRQALRRATVAGRVVPVLCGAALKNKGIQPLLDAIIDYLPSPRETAAVLAHDVKNGSAVPVVTDPEGPLVAYVFKVHVDEGRRMVYLRIYAGRLSVGDEVLNASRATREKVSRLFQMHAHHKQRIEQAMAGDIVAAVGLKEAVTGDTLVGDTRSVVLEPLEEHHPVISVAIEPRDREAETRFDLAIRRIMEEDPTIHVNEDPDTGQVIMAGMGELHLEVAAERFRSAFGVNINVGRPQVLYCTTVTGEGRGRVEFDKTIGETTHFGHVELRVRPAPRGSGNKFNILDKLDDEMNGHVLAGLAEACLADPVHGHEVVDIAVDVDRVLLYEKTSAQGTKIAAQMAVCEALRQAGLVRMEPLMEVDALVPEDHVGEVVGDLNARKGCIEGVENRGKFHAVKARVPLSRLFGYSTTLRSLTRGRGSFNMRFSGFDTV